MAETQILHVLNFEPEKFKNEIIEEIKNELKSITDKLNVKKETEYLTRKEVSIILQVTNVTLIDWEKKGILKPLRLGNLIRYRKQDIENSFTQKYPDYRNE